MDEEQPYRLQPGDYGIVVRANGEIDVLVPVDQTDAPYTPAVKALIGATIGLLGDIEYRHLCERRYDYEVMLGHGAIPGVTVQ